MGSSILQNQLNRYATTAANTEDVKPRQSARLQVIESGNSISIDTGVVLTQLEKDRLPDVPRIGLHNEKSDAYFRMQWSFVDDQGHVRQCRVNSSRIERRHDELVIRSEGGIEGNRRLHFSARGVWMPGSGVIRMEFMLRNSGRARHAGGYWDLGDAGSVLFRGLLVELVGSAPKHSRLVCAIGQDESPRDYDVSHDFEIFQASSGGEHWDSRNHVDRSGTVRLPFRGYRLRTGPHEEQGLRSSPVVAALQGETWAGIAVPEFWQQFPKAVSSTGGSLVAHLFPEQSAELFELQPGEQKTHSVYFAFQGSEPNLIQEIQAMVSRPIDFRESLTYAEIGQVAGLTAPTGLLRPELLQFVNSAIEGTSSFFAKREVVDEYGWRHFGDLWADHEGAYYNGPQPVISHFNNQYDALQAFLLLFQKTGDERWWQLADPLARHVIDIDIYHTDRDKSAYNGGLFWHTAHYQHAATATHRTMSRQMFPQGGGGGGPGNEHNYTTGLLLYHQLTRHAPAREAVIRLAEWVIAMDDGRQHLLGAVCDAPTGAASSTADSSYHGPGRGAGNSINSLLDAWLLTSDDRYWEFAETLIRRTIHPCDDIAARDLLNAELRWSYTVYLQSLFKFLDVAAAAGRKGDSYWYARESLLHYARWMAENEVFYLDRPERLEYPTETWAAQEVRKGNVLLMAAIHDSNSAERASFHARADEIHCRAWNSLLSFETKHFTRPTVLALQLGLSEAALRERLAAGSVPEPTPASFEPGMPTTFVSQKQMVKRALKSPRDLVGMSFRLLRPSAWRLVASHFWLTEIVRQKLSTTYNGRNWG